MSINDTAILLLAVIGALASTALFLYGLWQLVRSAKFIKVARDFVASAYHPLTLSRAKGNPILPRGQSPWEAEAVLNPAAVRVGDRTHLFYRAIGSDGVSRIGYASSADGIHFDERLPYPVFALQQGNTPYTPQARRHFHPGLVASGGSWNGAEDPRAVVIDGRIYLSFQAFEGWHSLRIGVTSLSEEDLMKQRWNWTPPTYLSPPGEVHKNWLLFPQKIFGKFAILHSISPTVEIAYRDSLEGIGTTEPYIESPQGPRTRGRAGHWDNWVRGAGAPPLLTPKGWLLFYHATDREKFSHQYKIGAMLLDKNNPSKIIARSVRPVLSPEAPYEMEGAKPGIVYTCGATIQGDNLMLYYGSADSVIALAATSLAGFLEILLSHKPFAFDRVLASV